MLALSGFIAGVVLVYLGMQYYVAFWTIRNFPGLGLNPAAVRLLILLAAACFPLSIYCLRIQRGAWAGWFAYLSYIWVGVILIWLGWAVLGDLALFLARLRGAAGALRPGVAKAVVAATALSILWSAYNAARMPRVKELEIELPHLPQELDGFTVVQLADVHAGVTVPLEKFARIVARVNELKPDLVVLDGDMMDPSGYDEREVARIGAGLQARHGVLAVLGNHELYHGAAAASAILRGMGATLLRNQTLTLPCGLQVAGVDDIMAARLSSADVAALLARLDPGRPSLFLSHQPVAFEAAAAAGAGLMLSGHTHQGQIFPFNWVMHLFYRHVHGLYRKGISRLYVTSGTGQWGPPMRLFTRAEIVRVRLRAPAAPSGTAFGKRFHHGPGYP